MRRPTLHPPRAPVQMTLGLDAMHRARVLHRDLKPANVLLTDALDAKLGDLGVAKVGGPLDHNGAEPVDRLRALAAHTSLAAHHHSSLPSPTHAQTQRRC